MSVWAGYLLIAEIIYFVADIGGMFDDFLLMIFITKVETTVELLLYCMVWERVYWYFFVKKRKTRKNYLRNGIWLKNTELVKFVVLKRVT